MAGKQKFHSLVLANGATIENFSIEVLPQDPIVTAPGRFWVNGTTNEVKYTFIDGTGALKIGVIGDAVAFNAAVQDLASQLAAEAARAAAAETQLQTDLSAEVTRATAAEQAELTRAQAAEAALQAAISALQTALNNAQTSLGDDIAAEAARAVGVEAGLDTRLAAVEATYATISYVDGKIASLGNAFQYVGLVSGGADAASAFDLATLTLKDAGDYYKVAADGYFKVGEEAAFHANIGDGLLWNTSGGVDKVDNTDYGISGTADFVEANGSQEIGYTIDLAQAFKDRVSNTEAGLTAEVSRAQTAEAGLQSGLNAEVSRATAAEAQISADLAAEVTRAQAAEQAEVVRAQAAEAGLQASIDSLAATASGATGNLVDLTTDAKGTLVAAINEVQAEVVAEASRAAGAESALQDSLSAEVTRAQAAEGSLQSGLDAEIARATAAEQAEATRATAAEGALQTALTAEVAAREAGDQVNADAIAAEVSRAQAAEAGIDGRLTTVETTFATTASVDAKISALGDVFEYVGLVDLGADEANAFDMSTLSQKDAGDYYKVNTAGFFKNGAEGTVLHANEGDGLLFNSLGAIDILDNTDFTVVGSAGFTEVSGSKDIGYTVDLDAAFKGRVSTLESGLSAETARAQAAETQLASDLSAEAARAVAAETALDSRLDSVEAAAGAGSEALKAALNAGRKTWRSTGAALVHTAVHGFNSDEFTYSVMVKGDDGVFRNDVVPVEIADANSVLVTLSESREIRVTFISTAQLA